MNDYRVMVYRANYDDGTSEWCAYFPDVKGVGGGGSTPEDALKDANENLEVHLAALKKEGLSIPKPSNPFATEHSGKFVVRISKSLHRDAVQMAEDEGISLNQFVSEAIAQRTAEKKAGKRVEVKISRAVFEKFVPKIGQEYVDLMAQRKEGGERPCVKL